MSNLIQFQSFLAGIIVLLFINQSNAQRITSFSFETSVNNEKIPQTIHCDIYGDSLISGLIPYGFNDFDLQATFTTDQAAAEVTVNSVVQKSGVSSNNFSDTVTYTVYFAYREKTYKVKLVHTGLHVVYINTDNLTGIDSKETYVNADIAIYPNKLSSESISVYKARTQIRGRGNSTWGMPKKPYRLKLADKSEILGMPAHKDWVLLANYADKTLLRNYLALDMGSKMDLKYTPRNQYIELVINGVYQGNYLLTEQIKIDKNRLNIHELDEDDEDISGGYLLEIDERLDEDYWFRTNRNVPVTLKSDVTPEQLQYITDYFNNTEEVLYSDNFTSVENGYHNYIDPIAVTDWYWLNEILKNNDATFFSSVYLFKDRGGLLNLGPIWDYDLAAGNVNYNGNDKPDGWWVKNSAWIERIIQDPDYKKNATERWNELKTKVIPEILTSIETQSAFLNLSQEQNFYKWPILNEWVWPNAVVTGSYKGEIDYLKRWLEIRIAWIDMQLNNTSTSTSFSLLYPVQDTTLSVNTNIAFSWHNVSADSKYKVLFDWKEGNFSSPLITFDSEIQGHDTTLLLNLSELGILVFSNPTFSNFHDLKWTVYAYRPDSDPIKATDDYHFSLVNDYIITDLRSMLHDIVLYPNPSQNHVRLKLPENYTGFLSVSLYDIMGKKIISYSNGVDADFLIDLDSFSKGPYIINLKDLYGNQVNKVLIIQ